MIHPKRIRVEYLKGSGKFPVVIDIRKPQITWNVEGDKEQTAYQVKAVGSAGICFDSGKVESREMKCVLDADFQSREIVEVEVRLWGSENGDMRTGALEESIELCSGETDFSAGSCEDKIQFEMGLLHREDWTAKWINPETEIPDSGKERPASYLKKTFNLEQIPRKARLYATAHGIYQIYINGKEVQGFVLAPGTSEYIQCLQYQTYDVTRLLKKGENIITAVLGNGWWRGTTTYDGVKNGRGNDVAFLAQLEADEKCVCMTEETWMATQDGPVRESDLMMGEIYDASRDLVIEKYVDSECPKSAEEANCTGEKSWHSVKTADFGYSNLVCSNCPPVLEHESFTPKLLITPKGETVLDFGQNIAGYIEFDMECEEGEVWKFTHFETLDANGNFCNSNFQSTNFYCAQEIIYKAKAGQNHFKAFGTFMGFRYVKVEKLDELERLGKKAVVNEAETLNPNHNLSDRDTMNENGKSKDQFQKQIRVVPDNFKAHAVYSDLEILADFQCGNPLVNQLYRNAIWSIKGNLIDIPTDCPTREKSGFTGDLVTYIHTFQYLMEAYPMVRKFIKNQAASQGENGCVKQIVADCRPMGAIDGAAGWSDSFEILPWKLGQRYNDYRVFHDNFEQIQKWMKFCIDRAASETRLENQSNPWKDYLYDTGFHWGEWAEPGADCMEELMYSGTHGNPEAATAYLAQGCEIMAEEVERLENMQETACNHLNKKVAAQNVNLAHETVVYQEIAQNAKKAYQCAFLENGIPVSAGYEQWKKDGGSAHWGNNTDVFSAILHEPEHISEERKPSERMCRYIRPIALNLVSEEEKQKLADQLDQLVKEKQYCLNTGFLTTHELCRTLSDYGHTDTAYRLLLNEECPGWLYSVKCGATTVPENWDAYGKDGSRNASFNHYSYGSIVGWLMDTAAGIRLKDGRITIAPKTSRELGSVNCRYQSPFGEICSSWRYEGVQKENLKHNLENSLTCSQVCCEFQIPDNCEAEICLENGEKYQVGPGSYKFSYTK